MYKLFIQIMSVSLVNYVNSKKENVFHLSIKVLTKAKQNEIVWQMEDWVWKIKINSFRF